MPALVRSIDVIDGTATVEHPVYEAGFTGGVRVAVDDLNGDGRTDAVVAPGRGGGSRIRALDWASGEPLPGPLGDFWAFEPTFTGGVHVATGDADGDGTPDVILGAGPGGGPRVRVVSGKDGSVLADFFAFSPSFTGGVSVAAADLNNDGKAEVLVGAGPGGGPHVRAFDLSSGTPVQAAGPFGSFYAFESTFSGGVNVSAGDVNGDSVPDIALGAGAGGGPRVRVLSGEDGSVLTDFFAFEPSATGGVGVSVQDATGDGKADVVVADEISGRVRVFDGTSGEQLAEVMPFDASTPLAATPFDISTFTASLSDASGNSIDMGGLRFYSTVEPTEGTGTYTFGSSSSPTWTLIGLTPGTNSNYAPLLLAYGATTLGYGPNLGNQVTWTGGVYAVSTIAGNVTGKFQISTGPGSFYASSLAATNAPADVTSIVKGTVTTDTPTGFQNGQAIQFADLQSANDVSDATTYYVVNASPDHPNTFDISATPSGPTLTGASAGIGQVAIDTATPLTVKSVVDGVVTTSQPSGYLPGQQVQFSTLSSDANGISADTTYFVVPLPANSGDNANQFAISNVADGAPLAANTSSGTVLSATDVPVEVTGISQGFVTTATSHGLTDGQAVKFTNLTGATGLKSGTTYYVTGMGADNPATQFYISNTYGGNVLTGASATGGGVLPDTSETIQVTGISSGYVSTSQPSGYTDGQAIRFSNLGQPSSQLKEGATYYVVRDSNSDDFTFGISLTPFGELLDKASADAASVNLSFANPPVSLGVVLPTDGATTIPMSPNGSLNVTNPLNFVATRVSIAAQGYGLTGADAVNPVLLFTGNGLLNFKGNGFNVGVGGNGANSGRYLQMASSGYLSYVDSNTQQAGAILTASFGVNPSQLPRAVNSVNSGLVYTTQPHGLKDGDSIVFTSLSGTGPGGLSINVPYQVNTIPNQPDELTIVGVNTAALNATGGSFELANSISIAAGVVTTTNPHGLKPGDAVEFLNLSGESGVSERQYYYVVATPSVTTFAFSESLANAPITGANATGGLIHTPLFKLGGLTLGGSGLIQILLPSASDPTGQVNVGGYLAGAYDNGSGVTAGFDVQLGSADDTAYGVSFNWDKDGNLTVPDWAFSLSGSLAVKSSPTSAAPFITATVSGLTAQRTGNSDGSEDVGLYGAIQATIPALNLNATVNLGQGHTNGLVIHTDAAGHSSLTSLDILAEFDRIQPSATPLIGKKLQLYGFQGSLSYSSTAGPNGTGQFAVGGALTIAVGDSTADANGDWAKQPALVSASATPGAVVFDDAGVHFDLRNGGVKLAISGSFGTGPLTFVANGMTFNVSEDATGHPTVGVSGEAILPSLGNTSITLGAPGNGGLTIDTDHGTWHLDGFRITVGKINLDKLILENISIGFTGGSASNDPTDVDNWDLAVSGTVRLMKFGGSQGMAISVKLDLGEVNGRFILNAIGAQIRGLNPGIAIGDTGGFATDIGLEGDNLATANWSGSFLLGGTFGNQVNIGGKEAALLAVTLQGMFDSHEFDLVGTLLFAGGALGTVNANLDFDWGIGDYSIDINGKFLYDAVTAELKLQVTPSDITALAEAAVKVPSFIPVIGGKQIASGEVYFHNSKDGSTDSFIAAWGNFFKGKWTDGFRHDFDTDKTSLIGSKQVNQIEADVPSDLTQHQYKTSVGYTPGDAADSSTADTSTGVYSRGMFQILWDGVDPTSQVFITLNGASTAVWGANVDTTQPIVDSTNNLVYTVSTNSANGEIYVQVESNAGDDPYRNTIPTQQFIVTLVSDQQASQDLTAQWSAGFTAPPPQVQNLAPAQPLGDALGGLGDGVDPNTVTIGLQYRTSDYSSTQIDLYYDFDGQGYDGIKIGSLSGSELNPPTNNSDWINQSLTWNIKDLPTFPVFIYAVIHDAQHAPAKTPYASQTDPNDPSKTVLLSVVSHPEINASIDLPGGGSESEYQDWVVASTPVLQSGLLSIVGGVVTTSGPIALVVGQEVQFEGLANAVDVVNDKPYYVTSVNSGNNTFTFSGQPGGPTIFTASATADANSNLYATDPSAQPLSRLTFTSGTTTLNPGVVGWYRVEVAPKSPAFAPDDSQPVNASGAVVQYVYLGAVGNEVNVQFNFTRTTIISGRVYDDTAADGTRSSADPGAAGIPIYLDDNGNGQLDAGETTAVTQFDGTYELYPVIPAVGTYTSTIRQAAPAGWLAVSANDDNTKTSLPVTITTANPQSLGNNFLDVYLVTLGGTVFNDANGNGVRDPGEAGWPNVTVNIAGPGGPVPVTTRADGSWTYQSKVRGTYTASVVIPTGTVVTTPNQASPQFGVRDANGDFASASPDSNTPLANSTAVASVWSPATGSYDTYAGVTWVNSDGAAGAVSVIRLDGSSSAGAAVWSAPVTGTRYVSQFLTSSAPGAQGLVFAVVNGWASQVVTDTQLVRINPDGSTSAAAVNSGEMFAAWPHLSGSGGLASVDPSGKVWSWSGASGYTRFAVGQVTGTPIDIVTFQQGASNGATAESIAVLVKVNGQMAVQILDPSGNLSAPITVGGVNGLSLAAGDFNADGIDDLAVLTTTASLTEPNSSLPAVVPYTVTFLVGDGKESFSATTLNGTGALLALRWEQLPSPLRLATVNLLGTRGDQLAWSTQVEGTGVGGSTAHLASLTGAAGGPFTVNHVSSNVEVVGGFGGVLTHALGTGELVVLATPSLELPADQTNNISAARFQINSLVDNTHTAPWTWTQSGGQFGGFDFGLYGNTNPGAGQNLTGVVFSDLNGNGVQDPGEPGLPGYTVLAAQPASSYASSALTGDADSGVSVTKTYTHALNFNGPAVTVNGVTFADGTSLTGPNYSLVSFDPVTGNTGGVFVFNNYATNLTGGMNALTQDFFYATGSGERLTLTGLTPGTTYTATFYGAAFGSGPRIQTVSDSQTGMIVGFDEDQYGLTNGQGNGIMLKATYTATGTSVTFTFLPSDPDNSFHQYAMTNEVATTSAPTAAWNRGVVSGDGSDGRAPGAYSLPATTGGFYVRPVAPPGATLPPSSLFALLPVGMNEAVPASFNGQPLAALAADLTRNGSTNLVVLSGTTIQVRLVKADGTAYYQQYGTGLAALSSGTPDLAAIDVNGDGVLDLVASGSGGLSVLLGIGGGEFAPARTFLTSQFAGQDVVLTAAPGGAVFAAPRSGSTVTPLEWDAGTATLVAGPAITSASPVQQLASGDIDDQGGFDLVVYDGTAVHVLNGVNYATDTVVASFTGTAAAGRLIVASLRGNAGQSILLARQVVGAATLTLVQVGSGGNYVQQTVPLGAVDQTAQLWIGVGDFADDNNGLVDVVAGAGSNAWLFVNDGPAAAPLVFAPSATVTTAAASARAFVPFTFTPHAPTDLVSIDAAGNLVGWHNLVHSVFVNGSVAMPAGQDLAVQLPGTGGGSITGTVWYDATNTGSWSPTDTGWSDGVSVYLDLNNNGQLDPGEPTESPSLTGQYTFTQVRPGTYAVRMILGTDGIATTMAQSWPASGAGTTVVVPSGPGTAVYGADFGVYVDENSADLNADGRPDLLLTDPSDGGVYVQLHRGTARLGTVRLGQLPGSTWSVVGTGDYSADGGPDVLLYDSVTGALRVWQIASGGGAPRVIREFDLRYHVPAGFAVVAFGDPDRQGKTILVLRNDVTGEHRTVTFSISGTGPVDTATESVLPLPSYLHVLGVGDLDGDGLNDLLVRDSRNGHLAARLYRGAGSEPVTVDLGTPDANWAVAGVLNLHAGPGADDILFQDRATGKAYIWVLTPGAQTPGVREIDIGTHTGLRVHFAEPASVSPPVPPVPPVTPPPAPPRETLSRTLAVGNADGKVTLFAPDATGRYGSPSATLAPFPGFVGSIRSAVADVDGDGIMDTVLVTGPGSPTRFAVVSGADNATLLVPPTVPFGGSEDFTGGGFVAAGDFDGDGRAEVVVTPDLGGGARVTIFSLQSTGLTQRANFFGIDDPAFRGGARVAVADVNGDGVPDLAVAAGEGGGPRVALFDGRSVLTGSPSRLVGDFFAFPGEDATRLRGGAFVAAGDTDGDGKAELVFGAGPGGAPRVFILNGALVSAGDIAGAQAAPVGNFFVANDTLSRGGIRVAVKDADGDGRADVVTGSGAGAAADVRVYLGQDLGIASPPTYQDLNVLDGVVLAAGVFVG